MTQEITVTIPAIDETALATIESTRSEAFASEVQALQALREKYSQFARYNGRVRIAYRLNGESAYLRDGEREIRAFLCHDGFSQGHSPNDPDRGWYDGTRLYLTENAEWLELERAGYWSKWQGEGSSWFCGQGFEVDDQADDQADDRVENDVGGSTETLTDAEVAARYPFVELVASLARQLTELNESLPKRLSNAQKRVKLAAGLLAALVEEA